MNRAADVVAEHVVDELVLFDAREPCELVGYDLGPEVVAAARQVLDLHRSARQGVLDAGFELV